MIIEITFEALKSICKAECINKCLLVDKLCNENICPIVKDYQNRMEYFDDSVQQPLSGSAETASPKCPTDTSDNGKRCVQ